MKTTFIIASLIAATLGAPTLSASARRQTGANLQSFTGALAGIAATPVTDSGDANKPFQVRNDTFGNAKAALQRSCDQQFNGCANAANGGDESVSVQECSAQKDQCDASIATSEAAAQGGAGNAGNANAGNAGNANAGNGTGNSAGNGNTGGAAAACKTKKAKRSNN